MSSDESTTSSTNELIDQELGSVIDLALGTDEISTSLADKRLGLTAADLRAHVLANRDKVCEPGGPQLRQVIEAPPDGQTPFPLSLGSPLVLNAWVYWRAQVLDNGVLPLLRTLINERMAPLLWSTFAVSDAPGLDRVRDSQYTVATRSTTRFLDVARQIRTGAIGIAGARGVGKTTVIDYYCPRWQELPITVIVSAPVRYDPREFVLHLYAELCRTMIDWFGDQQDVNRHFARRCTRYLVLAALALLAALLYTWAVVGLDVLVHPTRQHLTPPWLPLWPAGLLLIGGVGSLVLALPGAVFLTRHNQALSRLWRWLFSDRNTIDDDVVAIAMRHLTRIRFLQTRTTGWSGKLTTPMSAEFGVTGSTQRAEQPLTYPEVVHELREFLEWMVARTAGDPAVIVAVDELDKIDDPERAQQFINEIKGIFGVDRTQFLVSLSDDALASFERRGLPIRDAFDSAFDEIVRIEPLSIEDTCTLLKSRVIGVSDLFCALAHCMAGGLARDIIRTARSMRAVADDADAADIEQVCVGLVAADLHRKAHAFQQATSKLGGAIYATNFIRTLRGLRGLRAEPATLLTASSALLPAGGSQDDPELHWQAATYVYHCATLLEVFTGDLTTDRFTERRAQLETLAAAKQELGTHPQLAWLLVDECREAWGLPTVPTE